MRFKRQRISMQREDIDAVACFTIVATLGQVRETRRDLSEKALKREKSFSYKMASKDDSPTSLHGQPWSVWADRLGRDSPLSE